MSRNKYCPMIVPQAVEKSNHRLMIRMPPHGRQSCIAMTMVVFQIELGSL